MTVSQQDCAVFTQDYRNYLVTVIFQDGQTERSKSRWRWPATAAHSWNPHRQDWPDVPLLPPKPAVKLIRGCGFVALGSRVAEFSTSWWYSTRQPSPDSLARHLQAKLFDGIVAQISKCLAANKTFRIISILNIYGFKTFEIGSFEQFWINYAYENQLVAWLSNPGVTE